MMELTLKSNSKSKLEKVLALAKELGIRVEQKNEKVAAKIGVPQGKTVSAKALLSDFGKAPDFPTTDEVRSRTRPCSW